MKGTRRVKTRRLRLRRAASRNAVELVAKLTDAKGREARWQGVAPIFKGVTKAQAKAERRLFSKGGPGYLDKAKRAGPVEIDGDINISL